MSRYLKTPYVEINSGLFSAQSRPDIIGAILMLVIFLKTFIKHLLKIF